MGLHPLESLKNYILKNKKRKNQNQSSPSGITLVALVATIVILLMLVGITVVYIFGDNGVFSKAENAKNKTEQAKKDEQEYFNSTDNTINKYLDKSGGSISSNTKPEIGPDKKGEIQTDNKLEYRDENGDKAPIPGGFCVVKDSPSNELDKNTVKSGLVISDIVEDDLDNSKHGNQFVWIPVVDYSKFHLIEGYYSRNLQSYLSGVSNPSREAGDTTINLSRNSNSANSVVGTDESIAMYKSVKENKGFYIARFESGIAGTTASTATNSSNKKIQDGTVKPVSQKGVGVWNFIPWGGTTAIEADDNLPGNDKANGAVKVARSMYQKDGKPDGIHKVTSTLCYGVQWDATLNFIESNYINGTATGYVKDSTGMGNYTGKIATTGNSTSYQQKHIYDMAGNIWTWTMEAYDTGYRVLRGGDYTDKGNIYPTSSRYSYRPDIIDYDLGFRLALYL